LYIIEFVVKGMNKELDMKRSICVFVLSFVIMLAGCSSPNITPANPQYHIIIPSVAGEIPTVTFELSTPLSRFPDKAMIYRTVKPEVTQETVSELPPSKLGGI